MKKLAKRIATSGSADYDPFDLLGNDNSKKKKVAKEAVKEPAIKEEPQSGSEEGENGTDDSQPTDEGQKRGRPPGGKKRTPSESKENTPSKRKKGKWGGDRKSAAWSVSGSGGGHGQNRHYDDPLNWSIDRVYKYIKKSNCSVFAGLLKDQVIKMVICCIVN